MVVRRSEGIACGDAVLRPVLLAQLARYHDDPTADPPVLDTAGARVPMLVDVGAWLGDPPDGARIAIRARRHRQRYPVFTGTLRIVGIDARSSELVLEGRYDVPPGLAGALADRTTVTAVAKQGVQRLFVTMKDELSVCGPT